MDQVGRALEMSTTMFSFQKNLGKANELLAEINHNILTRNPFEDPDQTAQLNVILGHESLEQIASY